jgi:hypothetical protein
MQSRRLSLLAASVFVLLAGCSSVVQGTGQASFAPTSDAPTAPVLPTSTSPSSAPPLTSSAPVSSPVAPITSPIAPITSSSSVPARNPFPRAAASTAIGDPPKADLCAAIHLAALAGSGYHPTFNDVTVPPGCSIRMIKGGTSRFTVGVYGDRPGTASSGAHHTRRESGLTVDVYPYDKAAEGNCERDILAQGVVLHVYALSAGVGGKGGKTLHCHDADVVTRQLAARAATRSVPRLKLATPTLADLDFCAALRATDITRRPGFAGSPMPDGVGAGCLLATSNYSFTFYIDFYLSTPSTPTNTSPSTVGGHLLYAGNINSKTYCTFDSVQGSTPDGRHELVAVSASIFKRHVPHLCASSGAVLAQFLDAAGLQ